ncbi:30S ribosomal protein S12 methylthiotransferase RimO [Clostridium tetani]|uniref:Ribosomal protein uS12 methylthiotransferase RimO n=1 Tax=Clostridium tetani (strain Massachusetts / E88) TaxID=212717 RepID=RIMO_CLOTE|nr:30S ribosomal protein S12 methylthiotransferase RimO [Clostridium tetani]Q895I7.1 RecName: Full=Ribosomal protein uS12 methylthiotransferase RimO; Short=uS12 MTTase; Short=uS12 methylthiotransferase; AltName: Full=Ribosomal protein uS12 (aspartate-C(3))-methylthiotransferase; AltName: Full=Ribosome maturation factor RimO [Clostridium tetani E88]AAO35853.1 Fe-S oxidoreductase [Clostridium tetani E88]KGI38243.1 ribosomal protein S12 methylthiotransferase [Clostridium tetani]KGI42691.1 ribosoma
MTKIKYGVVSLGCDKNRIDSEVMINEIKKEGIITNDPKEADVIIVNTCGFIEDSKKESIDTILEMSNYKNNNCKVLVVTGCLSQRYGEELQELLPEVDVMLGVNDYDKLSDAIKKSIEKGEKSLYCNYSNTVINEGGRVLTTQKHYAYLRIAEGCDNFCTYCAIPKIRGKYRSRKIEDIIEEAKFLSQNGVKEIIIVAQDTTRYGLDIYGEKTLPSLLKQLEEVDGIEWIRLLYCYPEDITEELIEEFARNKKLCKYVDVPIQHISDSVLKRMGRKGNKQLVTKVLRDIKKRVPEMSIRTSLIVGFPGEMEEDFKELKDFVEEFKFQNLGVFKYSQEEGTPAATMEDQVLEEIKETRREELMKMQRDIVKSINADKVNKVYKVVVDNFNGEHYIGRNYEMLPEIDGAIYFKCDKILNIGEMVCIKILETLEYDLIGVVCDESCK